MVLIRLYSYYRRSGMPRLYALRRAWEVATRSY